MPKQLFVECRFH